MPEPAPLTLGERILLDELEGLGRGSDIIDRLRHHLITTEGQTTRLRIGWPRTLFGQAGIEITELITLESEAPYTHTHFVPTTHIRSATMIRAEENCDAWLVQFEPKVIPRGPEAVVVLDER